MAATTGRSSSIHILSFAALGFPVLNQVIRDSVFDPQLDETTQRPRTGLRIDPALVKKPFRNLWMNTR